MLVSHSKGVYSVIALRSDLNSRMLQTAQWLAPAHSGSFWECFGQLWSLHGASPFKGCGGCQALVLGNGKRASKPRSGMSRVVESIEAVLHTFTAGSPCRDILRVGVIVAFAMCSSSTEAQLRAPEDSQMTKDAAETSARSVCSTCHLFPSPSLLDRATWRAQTLPRMRIRMGLAPESVNSHPEAELLKATGKIPTVPVISPELFDQIEAFYLSHAPEVPIPQAKRGAIHIGLPGFEIVRPALRRRPASTTLVKISESDRRIYVGDESKGVLEYFNAQGGYQGGVELHNAPVSLVERSHRLYVAMIGSFYPSEVRKGALVELQRNTNQVAFSRTILEHLPRTVDVAFADLNQDGREDFVLCEFGNLAGQFCWFENLGNDQYREHPLLDKAGAVRCVIRDFNGDHKPDIAVLVAQETETLVLFLNQGDGRFKYQEVFRQNPLFGHTGFEVIDFNGDGRLDFLVTNGDNGEYPSPVKRFHGVRVYQDQGNLTYKESFFYPMNGAFKAFARDFDGDGDLDIAAVSYFPDYEKAPEESFVYLENRGNGRYAALSFSEAVSGRWLTMDVGDVDGDGDLDIVLGSYVRGPSKVPSFLIKDWEASGASFLILRNRLR